MASDTIHCIHIIACYLLFEARPRGYNFFMLNSVEHGIFPVYKCYNANNCWHFNMYEHEK